MTSPHCDKNQPGPDSWAVKPVTQPIDQAELDYIIHMHLNRSKLRSTHFFLLKIGPVYQFLIGLQNVELNLKVANN